MPLRRRTPSDAVPRSLFCPEKSKGDLIVGLEGRCQKTKARKVTSGKA